MFVYKVISKTTIRLRDRGLYIFRYQCPRSGARTNLLRSRCVHRQSEARAFTERLNTLQVSPIHLIDVIEDALGV